MWVTRICYAGYLIAPSKINFEQEIVKSILKGLDVGDINHSSELHSKFLSFISN